jgi:hypothetical protein
VINPRTPTPSGNPVNALTGEPMSDRQVHHLDAITSAGEALYEAMHFAEGSAPPGQHQEHIFLSRRMNIAATHLETALMYARKAALEGRP